MAEPYTTPRRFPRVKILGNVAGAISFLHEVTLLDLGEGGARLEHGGRFALIAICFLRLPAPEGELVQEGGSCAPLTEKDLRSDHGRSTPPVAEGFLVVCQEEG